MFGVALAISKAHLRVSANCENIALPRILKRCFCQEILRLRQPVQRIQTFGNWRTYIPNNRTWSHKTDAHRRIESQQIFKARPTIFQFFRNTSTNPLQVNTNVANNVMLYKCQRRFLYKGALLFGIAALIGCLTMADNVYLVLCKDLFNQEMSLKARFLANVFPLLMIGIGIIAGPVILFTVWYITKRSVKYVVLHKGGKTVTFVLHHPLKGETKMTLPATSLTCKSGRTDQKGYIPIKIRNQKFYFIIDKSGEFVNPELFDSVVAVRRF